MGSVPLVRCLPKMPSSSTHTGSQIATWRRSLTWTRRESSSIFNHCWRERCSSDCRHFSLNPIQRDILSHRQSQLSDLTIRLHKTTSLKSISQKRWLYHHGRFDQFNCLISISTKVMWPIVLCPHWSKSSLADVRYDIHKYVNVQASIVGPQ